MPSRIFNTLDDHVLLAVAQEMKPDVLGAILAAMQPDQAQKLTVKLADRLKLPVETPKPQTIASAAPVAPQAAATPPAPDAASGSVTVPPPSGEPAPQAATAPQAAAAPKDTAPAKQGG